MSNVQCVECVKREFQQGKCAQCWFEEVILSELRENCPTDDEKWPDYVWEAVERVTEIIVDTGADPESIDELQIYHQLLDYWTDDLHVA